MKNENEGSLQFTVDFPALFRELISPGNLERIGPGGAMGLTLVIEAMNRIGEIAIKNDYAEILTELANVGVVGGIKDMNDSQR